MVRRATATVVHRIMAVPDSPGPGDESDYVDAFEVTRSGTGTPSAEEWARAVFEGAPRPVRWFLLTGWRLVLGLRLDSRMSPGRVLGWRIAANEPDLIRLESQSSLISARLILRLSGSTAVLSTRVHYARPLTRLLWTAIGPIHRQALPYLLRQGVSSLAGGSASTGP
jgi:hypothetical protein